MRQRLRRLVLVAATIGLAAGGASVATTAGAAAAGRQVTYAVTNQWQGGSGTNVAVTNLGDPVSGWTLTWSFANGQTVIQAWNATVTQSGSAVTAANVSYNGSLATGASTSFGFNGTWTGANPVPTAFRLNNVACTGTVNPTASTSPTRSPTTGWVLLSGHDADGAAGTNGPMNRWYGGMVHELGHAFGLPDSTSTDGTPMSASFYNYPDTHFSQAQKNAILTGPYGGFLA